MPAGQRVEIHLDDVVAAAEAFEQIGAVRIGRIDGRAPRWWRASRSITGDVGDARFAGVLDAVGVEVVPHEVADLADARRVVAEVDRQVAGVGVASVTAAGLPLLSVDGVPAPGGDVSVGTTAAGSVAASTTTV